MIRAMGISIYLGSGKKYMKNFSKSTDGNRSLLWSVNRDRYIKQKKRKGKREKISRQEKLTENYNIHINHFNPKMDFRKCLNVAVNIRNYIKTQRKE